MSNCVLRALARTNLDFHCDPVSTLGSFAEKLSTQAYDVVLADYQFTGWTGMDALEILRNEHKNLPFILVTGALGEQKAVACLKAGVDDYILKGSARRSSGGDLSGAREQAPP